MARASHFPSCVIFCCSLDRYTDLSHKVSHVELYQKQDDFLKYDIPMKYPFEVCLKYLLTWVSHVLYYLILSFYKG